MKEIDLRRDAPPPTVGRKVHRTRYGHWSTGLIVSVFDDPYGMSGWIAVIRWRRVDGKRYTFECFDSLGWWEVEDGPMPRAEIAKAREFASR